MVSEKERLETVISASFFGGGGEEGRLHCNANQRKTVTEMKSEDLSCDHSIISEC